MLDVINDFGIAKTVFSLIVVALFILAFTHGGKGKGNGSGGGSSSGGSTPPTPPSTPAA